MAVGASGYATVYNGSSWSTPTDADASRSIDALSCVSSSFCVAVDTSGYAAKYNGSTWTATDIDSTRSIDTVSCASSSFCVAAGASGYVTVYNGSTWSTPTDADSTRTIQAVSCPTSSLCVAVDTSGYATTYNGSSWSTATDIDGSHALEALSCVSSSFCEASDNAGSVLTYNGSSWSNAQDVDATRTVSSVSCTSSTFCAAVDSSGYATMYLLVTVTSQLTWDTNGSLPLVLSDGTYDYIYGPSTTPVEEVSLSSSTPTYMTYTPSDSSWLIANAAGDETAFYGYDAFGNLAFGIPTSLFGYAGQYTDASTGLSNMRARWYGPQTGEFATRDPAFASTDSAYTYAGDDPVNNSDPSGLAWYDIFNPWSPNNPIRENAENGGLPSQLIQTFDPAYLAISGYMNEAEAAENGCSGWTEAEYGAEGVLGVAGTELFGLGGAGAVGGLFGGAADEGADSITGFTQHGLEQALGRDGGVGVSDSAMADAVTNPEEVIPQSDGAVKYVGKNAVVVLNSDGKVITTWATGSAGTR